MSAAYTQLLYGHQSARQADAGRTDVGPQARDQQGLPISSSMLRQLQQLEPALHEIARQVGWAPQLTRAQIKLIRHIEELGPMSLEVCQRAPALNCSVTIEIATYAVELHCLPDDLLAALTGVIDSTSEIITTQSGTGQIIRCQNAWSPRQWFTWSISGRIAVTTPLTFDCAPGEMQLITDWLHAVSTG